MTHPTPLIHAELVGTHDRRLFVPERMGRAREDQLQGTYGEALAELAGRVCYDSLGAGRGSTAYHRHILDVQHLSVYEHVVFTVEIGPAPDAWLSAGEFEREKLLPLFLNRPGVFVRLVDRHSLFVTLNVRAALEWATWSNDYPTPWRAKIAFGIHDALGRVCPTIAALSGNLPLFVAAAQVENAEWKTQRTHDLPRLQVRLVEEPDRLTEDETWITMLLTGSRGFSHELVRHGDFTAISQRSTRYVEEADSPWVPHPLLKQLHGGEPALTRTVWEVAAGAYRHVTDLLQSDLVQRGVDKLTARKQARGAARGYLGNALYTEVIFSASLAQWRRMIVARASAAADAEIREVFCKALRELKPLGLPTFTDLTIGPSPDGIGEVVSVS